jgi:hypothetical protein
MLKRLIQHAVMLILAVGIFESPTSAAIRGGFGHIGGLGGAHFGGYGGPRLGGFGGPHMAAFGGIGRPVFGGPVGGWHHRHGGGAILIGGLWVDPLWDWDPYWYDAAYYPAPVYAAAQTCEHVTVKRHRHHRVVVEHIDECW